MCVSGVNVPIAPITRPLLTFLDKISHNDLWRLCHTKASFHLQDSSEVFQEKGPSVGTPLCTNVASHSIKVSHEHEAVCRSDGTSALGLSCRGSGNPLVVQSILKRKKHFHQEDIKTVWFVSRFSASQPPTPPDPESPFSPPSDKEMKIS